MLTGGGSVCIEVQSAAAIVWLVDGRNTCPTLRLLAVAKVQNVWKRPNSGLLSPTMDIRIAQLSARHVPLYCLDIGSE